MLKVKIYGERNSGTNFLQTLIRMNFESLVLPGQIMEPEVSEYVRLTVLHARNESLREQIREEYFQVNYQENLGWKHAMAPRPEDLGEAKAVDILFLTITKNPYSWLLSLYKRPYHMGELQPSFHAFLKAPCPVVGRERYSKSAFDNPVDIWSEKNRSYKGLSGYAPNCINLRYEDLLKNPEATLQPIGNYLKRPFLDWKIPQESSKRRDDRKFEDYRDYYLRELWKARIDNESLSTINRALDRAVVESYGYRMMDASDVAK